MVEKLCIDVYTDRMHGWMGKYGFRRKEGRGAAFYTVTGDPDTIKEIRNKAGRQHIRCCCYGAQWARSNDYRKVFFSYYPPPYRCRYCNRKLKEQELVVDHIMPVGRVKKSSRARLMLKIRGIRNVNDPRNLAPSCSACNRRKSDKIGLWYLRGILGKYKIYWIVLYILLVLAVLFVVYSLYHTGFFGEVLKFITGG